MRERTLPSIHRDAVWWWRVERGLSRAELHRRSGLSLSGLKRLEALGASYARPDTLRKLATGLDVDPSVLTEAPPARAPMPPRPDNPAAEAGVAA